jgi:hypothetical protein
MRTTWLGISALVGLVGAVAVCRAGEGLETENVKLRAKLKKLEAENQVLRAKLARLQAKQDKVAEGNADKLRLHAKDLRRLMDLDKALQENPKDGALQKKAAALARQLAPDLRGHPLIWRVLLKTRTLKDGLSLADAEKLLGPPTEKSGKHVGWYFNPRHRRHVAPYLSANVTKEGLADWNLGSR